MNHLEHHFRTEKILTLAQAQERAEELRQDGKKLVTVNGSFDILHAGHLDVLEEAKQQGDILIVGINADEPIRAKKGEGRPIIPQQYRAAMLAALACVDYVVIIEGAYEDEPQGSFLPAIKPDVHVNAADYGPPETWIEFPYLQSIGAKTHSVEIRPGLSTSEIVDKIKKS